MTMVSKHQFISPEYKGKYKIQGSCTKCEPDSNDNFPAWLLENRIAEAGDLSSLLFSNNSLYAVSSEARVPSRDLRDEETYPYKRIVHVRISPPTEVQEIPWKLQKALIERGYAEKKD